MNRAEYRAALDRILPSVEKPIRYVGGEWNTVNKPPGQIRKRVALCFPDTYEIGMSHLGLKILYQLLNAKEDVQAERVYAPWFDMESALRREGLPLASIETCTPLAEFDILGFSFQYEMQFTNVLTVLDLAGIPLHSRERTLDHPLVIAGGPVAFSPEPMADFIDAFVIGDGEEAFPRIVDLYHTLRRSGRPRREVLAELARSGGVYVPELYDVETNPYHGLQVVMPPGDSSIPFPVKRQVIPSLDPYPFPSRSPIAFTEIVHDRISVEIARGCVDGCRFCQAGTIYRPVRERKPEDVAKTIIDGLTDGGYDEATLASLSTADYTCLTPLLKALGRELEDRRVSMSVTSLRANGLTKDLAKEIGRVRKTSFTLAPEAGTQRMRDVINKNVTEEDLLTSCRTAFEQGWTNIKLYFMIGQPTETDEDVAGIAELGRKVRELGRRMGKKVRITVAASSFVPKPHTPFQWSAMDSIGEIRRKQKLLSELTRRYQISFKYHDPSTSRLECIFSRADRKAGRVIERAWRDGCRMDGWSEILDVRKWENAFAADGIDPERYLTELPIRIPETKELAPLPWDHIDTLVVKKFLAIEWDKALKARISPPCGLPVRKIDGRLTVVPPSDPAFRDYVGKALLCYVCGLDCDLNKERQHLNQAHELHFEQPESLLPAAVRAEYSSPDRSRNASDEMETEVVRARPLYQYRARFAKLDPVKYLSHLDLVRTLPRAFRRAGIELAYSKGFHPMPVIAYGPALGVGVVGEEEFIDFQSPDVFDAEEFLVRINLSLPEGLRFTGMVAVPPGAPSLAKLLNRAEYCIPTSVGELQLAVREKLASHPSYSGLASREMHERLAGEFLALEHAPIVRRRASRTVEVDVREGVLGLRVEGEAERQRLVMTVEIANQRSARPSEIVGFVYGLREETWPALTSRLRRTRLFVSSQGQERSPLDVTQWQESHPHSSAAGSPAHHRGEMNVERVDHQF